MSYNDELLEALQTIKITPAAPEYSELLCQILSALQDIAESLQKIAMEREKEAEP